MHANLSIDEQMIPYTGMHSAKQRMKDKSIRFGYKIFVLAGPDGFPYHIVPYVSAKGVPGDPGKVLTSRISLQLALNNPTGMEVVYSLTTGLGHTRFLLF